MGMSNSMGFTLLAVLLFGEVPAKNTFRSSMSGVHSHGGVCQGKHLGHVAVTSHAIGFRTRLQQLIGDAGECWRA